MLGGKLLATGSDSCIFTPNLPCQRNGVVDDNRISKIIYGEEAIQDGLYEKKMNEKIKKIKGSSSWAIIFDKFCKPLPKETLMEYDKKGIDDCIGDNEDLYQYFDEISYMMNGNYGGETMDDYFYRIFERKNISLSTLLLQLPSNF